MALGKYSRLVNMINVYRCILVSLRLSDLLGKTTSCTKGQLRIPSGKGGKATRGPKNKWFAKDQ